MRVDVNATHIPLDDIVVVVRYVPSQTKVTDLGHAELSQQHVPGSNVPVNTLHRPERHRQMEREGCVCAL